MGIETIAIEQAKDDEKAVEVTIRGDPAQIIPALVNGLPREALEQIRDAIQAELKSRQAARG